jgi:hypothetical protein
MAKLSLTDVANITGAETSAINTFNANWDLIEAAMELTLTRTGTTPNSMQADLDMNSNDILNVGSITFADGTTQIGITGPDPSVDNTLARWDGVTGLLLDDCGWVMSDTDVLTAAGNLLMGGNNITGFINLTFNGADGVMDMNWSKVIGHCEVASSVTSASNVATLDVSAANYFYTTLTENITTVTTSNLPASGKFTSWQWEITQDAGASGYTITWPAAVKWAGDSAPTLTATASAVDIISFWTRDAGTTIHASLVSADSS